MRIERVKLHRVGERATIKAELVSLNRWRGHVEDVVAIAVVIKPKSKAGEWLDQRMADKAPLRLSVYWAGKPVHKDGYQIEQLDWEFQVSSAMVTARLVRPIPSAIDARYFNKDGSIGGGYEAGLAPGLKYPVSEVG